MNDMNPQEWTSLAPHFEALQQTDLTHENVNAWLHTWSDLTAILMETDAQIYRDISENTADSEADARFLNWIENIMPEVQVAEQALKEKWLALEGYTPGPEIEQHYKRTRTEAEIFRKENVPLFIELSKLSNQAEKLVGGMLVEWDGEKITVPQAQQKLEDPDRSTRERVWKALMGTWAEARTEMNRLYLEMRTLRQKVARNAGFDNFRDYTWQAYGRFDYTPADAFTFHDAIEHEVVPLASDYYRHLQEKLGVDALRPWDEKASPDGEQLLPFDHVDELEAGGGRIFEQVDPELGAYYTAMRDGWLDLASRPNKRPGGYCNSFPVSKSPYIFMNAVNNNRTVTTLLHEGGHAFHFMESVLNQPLVWNTNAPMEFCEVASMSMELLSAPFLSKEKGGFYGNATHANRAYAGILRDGFVLFLPYMAVVDAFQHWVYADAGDDITSDDLDAKWGELWDRFMPGLDYSGYEAEKVTGWHRKMHIFSSPFYYIEYGLAQVGALQVWRNSLNDYSQAVADYRHALRLGGTLSLSQLFEAAGAKFAFDRPTLNELGTLTRQQLEILEN
jgi:oligoendopeptidase F